MKEKAEEEEEDVPTKEEEKEEEEKDEENEEGEQQQKQKQAATGTAEGDDSDEPASETGAATGPRIYTSEDVLQGLTDDEALGKSDKFDVKRTEAASKLAKVTKSAPS